MMNQKTDKSEKLLFKIINRTKENIDLRHQLEREQGTNIYRIRQGIELYGHVWLQDLTILELYHGTELSSREISSLKFSDLVKLSNSDWQIASNFIKQKIVIPANSELSYLLEFHQLSKHSGDAHLFYNRDGFILNDTEITALVIRYSKPSINRSIASSFSMSSDEFAVIPTPLRVNANPRYTGKRVTIAFIDSGFFPHPDLIYPENRILTYVNLANPSADWSELSKSNVSSWHGMQTSVSACGNGYLSQGLYRGIASNSNLVLIQISDDDETSDSTIAKGIEWAIKHKNEFSIRIINISMGCNDDVTEGFHPVNKAAEEAVAAGIAVVVAAGNDPGQLTKPPASSLSVITVGGVDDSNIPFQKSLKMYHSSFGSSVEGYVKPEVIAPAIWIAAPVLPGSPLYFESLIYHKIIHAVDAEIIEIYLKNKDKLSELPEKELTAPAEIRSWAEQRIKEEKLIATHYQHVDGTSFAAPITSSVIAQMLEVNDSLTPKRIKKILIGTARSIEGVSPYVQGFGVISPYEAVEAAIANRVLTKEIHSPNPKIFKNLVTFNYYNPQAETVEVVGDFNQWSEGSMPMVKDDKGNWSCSKEFLFAGRYRYKFFVDNHEWIFDPMNTRLENDGYNGHNSIFFIHTPGNAEEVFKKFTKTIRITNKNQHSIRKKAFVELDKVLQSPLSNRSYRVRQFFAHSMEIAIEEMRQEINKNNFKIWQCYNHGYIASVSHLMIAFDVVSTRNVYNLFWDLEPTIVSSLSDLIDILFVTHRHPDHLDLELVNALIRKGKKVIIPAELSNLLPFGAIGMKKNEERTITFPSKFDDWLKIKAHEGLHVYDKGRNIDIRYYEVSVSNGIRFLHLGDHDYTKFIAKIEPVNVLFPKCGGVSANFSDKKAMKLITKKVSTEHLLPGHINEIGHPVKGGRISYETAFACMKYLKTPWNILAWGEAIKL